MADANTLASEYADNIAGTIRVLDLIIYTLGAGFLANADVFDGDELDDMRQDMSPVATTADDEDAAIGWIVENADQLAGADGRVGEVYLNDALEAIVHGRRQLGAEQFEPQSLELLVTFGGPNARVTIDRDVAVVVVQVVWGTGEATRHVDAPDFGHGVWMAAGLYDL